MPRFHAKTADLLHIAQLLLCLLTSLFGDIVLAILGSVDSTAQITSVTTSTSNLLGIKNSRLETAGNVAGVLVDFAFTLLAIKGLLAAQLLEDLLAVLLGRVRGVLYKVSQWSCEQQ